MPIKLINVTRDLNVGITSVVEFLHKKGHHVESNPNTKISDEQYALLVNEFGKGLHDGKDRDRSSSDRFQKEKRKEVIEEVGSAKPEKSYEIKTEIPEEYKPRIVTKGKINLDEPFKKQEPPVVKEAPVIKKEEKPVRHEVAPEVKVQSEPVAETTPVKTHSPKEERVVSEPVQKEIVVDKVIVEDKQPMLKETPKDNRPEKIEDKPVETTSAETENESEEVYRINTTKFESNIKVTGKIDLNALNQSTRPKKKTKEEKRKERDDKRFPERKVVVTHKGPKDASSPRPAAPVKVGDAPRPGAPVKAGSGPVKPGDDAEKKKRKRIKKERVDVASTPGSNNFARPTLRSDQKPRLKKPVKAEVSEEDVQKQIKETLARLTSKGKTNTKGAKYRRDKRDAASRREHELLEQEERESMVLKLTEFVTANDLANMMDVPVTKVIGTCMSIGIMVSINQRLDAETINIVAEEFGFKTEYVSAEVVEAINADEEDNEEDMVTRPPIVTVMGHVDHGKTSLLDNIRNANVIAGEAGGITQHIGAYNVKLENGQRITFLDTPGHEAFTAMRARGAKVTDIAIIIVAADDNVMPQTIEAINHASAAGVPMVFAINKVDKPSANPDKIKETLANMNYLVEDWGGKYQSQDVSAKQGLGMPQLLEKVLLEAEMLELKANPHKRAVGSVIESSLDKGRGYVATVLVQNGTLKMGDFVLAGTYFGRIKAMFNERNQRINEAKPSEPVLILGLNGAPQAGDNFNVMATEHEARDIANKREQLQREQSIRTKKHFTLDELGRRIALGDFKELNIIVKGDVDGSVEALSDSLLKLSTENIQVNVIHKAVGAISDSDILLAAASNAIICGFQVRPTASARKMAEKEEIDVRMYSVIYDAIEEIKSAMEGMLSPEIKEEVTATVEVREVFKITKVGTVAGCLVREGKIKRTNKVRIIRDGIVIYTGELDSLKRFKDDVKEVGTNFECGLNIKNYNDIREGDMIESFEETEVKKSL